MNRGVADMNWLGMLLWLLLFCCSVTGCATVPKPLEGIVPGRALDSLSAAVGISLHSGDRSSGGRGYLVFRQPDRFRLVVLSPFGLTLMELFVDGETLTCILPSKQVAYSGRISDLPERDGLKSWGLMRWVVDMPPAAGPALYRDHITREGVHEKVYYDARGLVIRKESESGDEVRFLDYRVVDGVALAEVIEIISAAGERVRLTFSDPEVNGTVDDGMLRPNLDGLRVLPFTEFKGFAG